MWTFHNTSIWFLTCCFLFPWLPLPNFSISRLCGSHITIKTFFDGRPIERARQNVDFSTHEWQLRYKLRFSKLTLCIRRHERNGAIRWSLIGHKKYNATKFVLNPKQESKWAFELVCWRYPPRGYSRPSCKLSLAPDFSSHLFRQFYLPLASTICPWVSEDDLQILSQIVLQR